MALENIQTKCYHEGANTGYGGMKMNDLIAEIARVDPNEINDILDAVLERYAVLFPDWEVSTISLRKSPDRNEQIDRMIRTLQNLKTAP